MYSNSSGFIIVVDGNVLILLIIKIGLYEFWWGMFDVFYKISVMYVIVGKGIVNLFYSIIYLLVFFIILMRIKVMIYVRKFFVW